MYKLNNIIKIINYLSITILSVCVLALSSVQIHAQSAESLTLETSIDKKQVEINSNFVVNIIVKNISTVSTIYDAKIIVDYIDKLTGINFISSSTGLDQKTLSSQGYTIKSLSPGKSIGFSMTFRVSSSAVADAKIINTLDNSTDITNNISFRFSQDTNAVVFSKNSITPLPDVINATPEIAQLKYPSGVSGYDLSKITSANVKAISGFYLEGTNKITFLEDLDLSTLDAFNAIKNLNTIIDINTPGTINITQNNVFNKKAAIELKNVNFLDTPVLYLNTTQYTKPIQYDKTAKMAKFDIDTNGKYTLVGEVKLDIPKESTNKLIDIKGIVTSPTSKVEIKADGEQLPTFAVDLATGNFKFKYEFKDFGTKTIETFIYAPNGTVHKQTTTIDINPSTTAVPSTTSNTTFQPKEDKFYINILIYSLIGIFAVTILVCLVLLIINIIKKRRNKKLGIVETDSENPVDKSEIVVKSLLEDHPKEDIEASENRHEIIRAKVYNKPDMDSIINQNLHNDVQESPQNNHK